MVEEVNGPSCYMTSEYIPGMHTSSCGGRERRTERESEGES